MRVAAARAAAHAQRGSSVARGIGSAAARAAGSARTRRRGSAHSRGGAAARATRRGSGGAARGSAVSCCGTRGSAHARGGAACIASRQRRGGGGSALRGIMARGEAAFTCHGCGGHDEEEYVAATAAAVDEVAQGAAATNRVFRHVHGPEARSRPRWRAGGGAGALHMVVAAVTPSSAAVNSYICIGRRAPDHFSKQAPATSLKNLPVNSI